MIAPAVVVAGLGSQYRRDDGVGPRVAALSASATGTTMVGPYTDPLDLLGWWDGAALAVIVDATRSGATPGTIQVVELGEDSATSEPTSGTPSRVSSTHGIGLAGVLRLARAVDRAPRRVVLVGIEGRCFDNGEGLSADVESAVERAVARVVELVSEVAPCA